MTLNDVATAVVDLVHARKYILASFVDPNGKERKLVRTYNLKAHEYIFQQLISELTEKGVEYGSRTCLGGGYIFVDNEEKVIMIYGYSLSYGAEPDRDETIQILQEAYPEFRVEKKAPSHTQQQVAQQ